MNEIEKAEEYAKNYKPYRDESTYSIAKKSFIAGSKSGYSAGVKSGIEIARNNDLPDPDCHFQDAETKEWVWAYSKELIEEYLKNK